jgi:hypothetical protein
MGLLIARLTFSLTVVGFQARSGPLAFRGCSVGAKKVQRPAAVLGEDATGLMFSHQQYPNRHVHESALSSPARAAFISNEARIRTSPKRYDARRCY